MKLKLGVLARFGLLPGPVMSMITIAGAGFGLIAFMLVNHIIRNKGLGDIGRLMPFIIWIVAALVVILLILLAIELVRRWRSKKKGESLAGSIEANAKAAPRAVSPEQRQKIEEMRKSFLKGLETFRENGKNVYEVPWYLVVGVPGSGKTEAVRRSGISFPPDLNQSLQGVGGTINMDWWFASDAVILDTAGRILVEDVDTGGTSEWDQLLEQLRRFRKNRPINGVMIVLPAASSRQESDRNPAGLVEESSNDVEENVARFVDRLVRIRRKLKVRFPVCIVVTKCDRLLGFEEFFYSLSNASDQAQMLGWSNPNPLDQPYKGELVNQAVREIADRLRTMRMWILRNPIHSTDARARRTDEVDGLYALPDALESLVPNLRLYLDRMFTKSAWYDPPFLRGIYFTSSIQEGSAIDPILAEMFHVQPREVNLPSPVPQEKRSYFLRDVLEKKLFVERGLVTSAANVAASQRKLKLFMWGGALAAAVLLIALGLWGYLCQANWNREFLDPWKAAVEHHHGVKFDESAEIKPFREETAALKPEATGIEYTGRDQFRIGEFETRAQLQQALFRQIGDADTGFMCGLFHGPMADSAEAQARLFGRVVAGPVAHNALTSIIDGKTAEGADAGLALAELLRWATLAEGLAPEGRMVGDERPISGVDFAQIAAVIPVAPEDRETWRSDLDATDAAADYDAIFNGILADDDIRTVFLPFALGMSHADLRELRIRQFDRALEAVASADSTSGASPAFGDLQRLIAAMEDFENGERDIWQHFGYQEQGGGLIPVERWYDSTLNSGARLGPFSEQWRQRVQHLVTVGARIDGSWAALSRTLDLEGASAERIAEKFRAELVAEERRRKDIFDGLARSLPVAAAATDVDRGAWLLDLRTTLETRQQESLAGFTQRVEAWKGLISRFGDMLATGHDGAAPFRQRIDAYQASLPGAVEERLDESWAGCDIWSFDDLARAATPGSAQLLPIVTPVEGGPRPSPGAEVIRRALDVAGRIYIHRKIRCMLESRWPDEDAIARGFPEYHDAIDVEALSAIPYTPFYRLEMDDPADWLMDEEIPAFYAPGVASALLRSAVTLEAGLGASGEASWRRYWPEADAADRAAQLRRHADEYAGDYLGFWETRLRDGLTPMGYRQWRRGGESVGDWSDAANAIVALDPRALGREWRQIDKFVGEVLAPVRQHADWFSSRSEAVDRLEELEECMRGGSTAADLVQACNSYVGDRTRNQSSPGTVAARVIGELVDHKETDWPPFISTLVNQSASCAPANLYVAGLTAEFARALADATASAPGAEVLAWRNRYAGRFPIDTTALSRLRGDLNPVTPDDLLDLPEGRFPRDWLRQFEELRARFRAPAAGEGGSLRLGNKLSPDLVSALTELQRNLNSEDARALITRYDALLEAMCGRAPSGDFYDEIRNRYTILNVSDQPDFTPQPGRPRLYVAIYSGDPATSDPIELGLDAHIRNDDGDTVEIRDERASRFTLAQPLSIDILTGDWEALEEPRDKHLVRSYSLDRWAVLQMLYAWSDGVPRDPKVWTVRVPTGAANEFVRFDIEFERDVPVAWRGEFRQ